MPGGNGDGTGRRLLMGMGKERRRKEEKIRKKEINRLHGFPGCSACRSTRGEGCLPRNLPAEPLPCPLHLLCREFVAHSFPQALARK